VLAHPKIDRGGGGYRDGLAGRPVPAPRAVTAYFTELVASLAGRRIRRTRSGTNEIITNLGGQEDGGQLGNQVRVRRKDGDRCVGCDEITRSQLVVALCSRYSACANWRTGSHTRWTARSTNRTQITLLLEGRKLVERELPIACYTTAGRGRPSPVGGNLGKRVLGCAGGLPKRSSAGTRRPSRSGRDRRPSCCEVPHRRAATVAPGCVASAFRPWRAARGHPRGGGGDRRGIYLRRLADRSEDPPGSDERSNARTADDRLARKHDPGGPVRTTCTRARRSPRCAAVPPGLRVTEAP